MSQKSKAPRQQAPIISHGCTKACSTCKHMSESLFIQRSNLTRQLQLALQAKEAK